MCSGFRTLHDADGPSCLLSLCRMNIVTCEDSRMTKLAQFQLARRLGERQIGMLSLALEE